MSVIMRYGTKGERSGGSGGGGSTANIAVLWTNSDPTSNFSAKTVDLSDAATNYDFLLFTYAIGTSAQRRDSTLIPVNEIVTDSAEYDLLINSGSANRTGSRTISMPSATSVTFGTGAYNGSASANGYVIPIAIYGIKL